MPAGNNHRNTEKDILWTQLKALPAFRALVRACEAHLFSRLPPLPHPILDLGCGDGHFAQAALPDMDAGIDLNPASLAEAHSRRVYHALAQSSATALPFASHSFATVVSNCVIEHIPDNIAVMQEAARVLKPGGQFIFSVPTDRLNPSMFTPTLLNAMGASGLANRYMDWFTRMQVHYHLYTPDEWQRRAEAAGLRVVRRTGYLSPRAARFVELGHFLGLPNLVWRKLTGRWVIFPWRPRFALVEALLQPLALEVDPPDATCCFFIAAKD